MPDIKYLLEGFGRFHDKNYGEGGLMPTLVRDGQKPDFLIISCMDSRASPEILFNLKPGSCFTHRPMGALVQPYDPDSRSSKEIDAKLTFAIEKGVRHIIILGHTHCSAAVGLASNTDNPHIKPWLEVGKSALKRAQAKANTGNVEILAREVEKQIIITDLHNVMKYPAVKDNLGKVIISGWLFDMEHGQILELNPETGEFALLTQQEIKKVTKTRASAS